MPSATTASYEDDFVSERLLTFMHNGDYTGVQNMQGSFNEMNTVCLPMSADKSFSLDKDGSLSLSNKSNPVTCNSPINHMTSGYPAMPSPHMNNRYTTGVINSAFTTPNPCSKNIDEYHSLQNSPFYHHYPVNGMPAFRRQNDSTCSNVVFNGNPPRGESYPSLDCQMMLSRRPPQRELFPSMPVGRCDNGWTVPLSSMNNNGVLGVGQPQGLLAQDRIYYNSIAQKHGFIVGVELERIKENCRRSTSHTYGRISAHFRNRYGETEAKTKAAYMQLGVRVPSKDHVSEIVGKGGQKIKLIREETGALITTPGEYEDHVFIIEAPPEIALSVADLISTRAQEITQSKLSANERRRGSTNSIPGGVSLFSVCSNGAPGNSRLTSRSPEDLPTGSLPSPPSLLKTGGSPDGVTFSFTGNGCSSGNPGFSSSSGIGGSNGRILLARSKISVPQDMVGKIIGTQGSIITTIQKDTGTEIKSPPKEAARGPSATSEFEISAFQSLGMTSNQAAECRVQQAKQLIGHLVMRQFERRASEELEDATGLSGKSRQNSTGDECDENGSSSSGGGCGGGAGPCLKAAGWMWPDVAQMDQTEAREVLDRILAESKSKTRRAKELAAATSGSVPPSPGAQPNGFCGEFFPPEKITASNSCQNSPFHRPQVGVAPCGTPTARNGYAGPAQLNLLNGFMSERILPGADYQNENEYHVYGGSSSYWPTQIHNNQNHHLQPSAIAVPRHSFTNGLGASTSAGMPMGQRSPPAMIRRHTMASDFIDHRLPDYHNPLLDSKTKESSGAFDLLQQLESLCIVDDSPSGTAAYPPGFNTHRSSGTNSSPSNGWPTTAFNGNHNGGLSDGISEGSANSDSFAMKQIWGEPSTTFNGNPGASISIGLGAIGDRRRRSNNEATTTTAAL